VITWSREHDEHEPLAGALLLLGQVQTRRADSIGARATLIEAVRAAAEVKEDRIGVEAWLELVSIVFFDRDMLPELDGWILGTEVAASRLAKDDELQTKLAFMVGSAQLLRGDIDGALAKLERALADYKREPDKRKYDIAGVENSLGVAHMYRGEWDAARASMQRALDVWDALPILHPNLASTLVWQGELAILQHDFAAALPPLKRAVDVFEAIETAGKAEVGKARLQLGMLYARTGKCRDARPLFAAARKSATAQHGKQSVLIGYIDLGEGICELSAGHTARAIAQLERANHVTTRATLIQAPLTNFTLARALVRQDRDRAIALAEAARDGFARFAGAAEDRKTVEAWLASHR
jgi:tetratricopeptide (TPR) repeat protein